MDAEKTPQPLYKVISISCPQNTSDAYVAVLCNAKLFEIYVIPQNLEDDQEERKQFLQMRRLAVGRSLTDKNVQDLCDWITAPFMSVFQSYALYRRVFQQLLGSVTLNELVQASKIEYALHAIGNLLEPIPYDSTVGVRRAPPIFGAQMRELQWRFWPEIQTDQIVVPNSEMAKNRFKLPQRVLVNGRPAFLKYVWPCNKSRRRLELENYTKVCRAADSQSVRIPGIIGIVRNASTKVYGILYTWIESEKTLASQTQPQVPMDLQERWAGQVKDVEGILIMARLLHKRIDLAKVLIDTENNAWYTGLGDTA